MAIEKRPFSGEIGFLPTVSNWPITHMVAPKADAVKCAECHSRNSRLAGVPGIYMPGFSHFGWLDFLGLAGLGLTLFGVAVHGGLRIALDKKIKGRRVMTDAVANNSTSRTTQAHGDDLQPLRAVLALVAGGA